jgi:4-nitrophenyl phosphatase
MGIEAPEEHVLTSALASAEFMKNEFASGTPIYAIGEEPLRKALVDATFVLTKAADTARAVVVGMDRKVNWKQLMEATLAIRGGALFVGTNPDTTFPIERGLVPGNGALLAALESATGVRAKVIGKPEPHLFLQAAAYLQTEQDQTLVVGDRLETDILGGQRAGMSTALILTGVTSRDDLASSSIHPDYVFDDLHQLSRALLGGALE